MLYELAHREELSAKEIGAELGLDAGYLSRIVQNFDEAGLITRKPLPSDRRQYRLASDRQGTAGVRKTRPQYARRRRGDAAAAAARRQGAPDRGDGRDRTAARRFRRPLGRDPARTTARRHGMGGAEPRRTLRPRIRLRFLVRRPRCRNRGKFLASFDASRERCWIADIEGAQVGSVFLVRHTDDTAKLRLLLVDPAGRGQGLGQRLVGECIAFATACGYRRITLWTQSILVAARKIYQEAGFELVATEPHRSFGQEPDRRNLGTRIVKPDASR